MFQIADESMLSHTRREAPRYSSSPFIFGLARAISKRCLSRRLRRLQCTVVQAAVQKKPSGTEKRRPTEPPWYHGKFRVMSSRLADWLSCPEDVRPARQVVQLLWKYPGNVSNLVAHEAAQCVAFRAAATTVMYGPSLEHEVSISGMNGDHMALSKVKMCTIKFENCISLDQVVVLSQLHCHGSVVWPSYSTWLLMVFVAVRSQIPSMMIQSAGCW